MLNDACSATHKCTGGVPLIPMQGPWQAAIEAAVAAIEATDTDCRVLDIGSNAG